MRSPTMWLGIAGGVLMSLLLFAGVKGSMVMGIIFVTVISWIPNHAASYLGKGSPIAGRQRAPACVVILPASPLFCLLISAL
jgi:AGZA family xanthine/uracil permease-like MFS transporter